MIILRNNSSILWKHTGKICSSIMLKQFIVITINCFNIYVSIYTYIAYICLIVI